MFVASANSVARAARAIRWPMVAMAARVRGGGSVGSGVVLSDTARSEAALAQDRLDAGERLPLLGVPVAIKDDVDVAGEVTACGSGGHRPAVTSDAEAVRRLRAAGAVIIGKTNVPELM